MYRVSTEMYVPRLAKRNLTKGLKQKEYHRKGKWNIQIYFKGQVQDNRKYYTITRYNITVAIIANVSNQ